MYFGMRITKKALQSLECLGFCVMGAGINFVIIIIFATFNGMNGIISIYNSRSCTTGLKFSKNTHFKYFLNTFASSL